MKRSLLLLGVIAALAIGAPAYSQYIYLDTDGNGVPWCGGGSGDGLAPGTSNIDVWLSTDHDANGTLKTCDSNASQPLSIFAYDILWQTAGSGSVVYNTWTNAMTGFTQINPLTTAGTAAGVSFSGPSPLAPGLYKLGTINVTVTGTPVIGFRNNNSGVEAIPTPATDFGTNCDATDNPNTYTLGIDFVDACGTQPTIPVTSTTWGKIKQLYK